MTGIEAVLIPASLTEGTTDGKIQAYKVGQVARAAAIHRVPEIVLYPDPDPDRLDDPSIEALLSYAEAPPYLRKILFARQEELRHAGVLPPLHTPHHKAGKHPRIGDVRDGYAAGDEVEIGADRPAKAAGDLPDGRVTVEIVGREDGRYVVAHRRGPPPGYWGYQVTRAESLTDALDRFETVVMTSARGDPEPAIPGDACAVAFGAPGKGLGEMLAEVDADPDDWPVWYDAVPDQGTETIRTEEAVVLALEPVRKLLVGQS